MNMNKEKIELMKKRIEEEIQKIDNKDFSLYFYVIDSKGTPSGSLSYIYDIAYGLQQMGYKVGMLHSEEDFVGVGEWIGDKYAGLPHYNVDKKSVDVSPSDLLFIPEIYANVMSATKKLPCQRIAIFQGFDKLTEFIPFGVTWSDLGIKKAITTSDTNVLMLKKFFPYTSVDVITPKLSEEFFKTDETKKLIVNVVTRNSSDINKIVKPFFWQYPMYQWVAFRELRGLSRDKFAKALQEAAITIWVDDETNFGYIPLEAMKCGSLVIGKTPNLVPNWMFSEEENTSGVLSGSGIWFDNLVNLPSIIASVIRTWTMDEIPNEIQEEADKLVSKYSEGKQLQDIKNIIIDKLVKERRDEFVNTLENLNNEEKK